MEPDCLSTDGGARFMETHGGIRFQRSGVSGPCRMTNISAMCGVCSLGIAVVAVSLGQMLVINVQRPSRRVDKVRFSFSPIFRGDTLTSPPPVQSSLEIPLV